MREAPQTYCYQNDPKQSFFAWRLKAGEVVRDHDLFECGNGIWIPCPCPGFVIADENYVRWVRPLQLGTFEA